MTYIKKLIIIPEGNANGKSSFLFLFYFLTWNEIKSLCACVSLMYVYIESHILSFLLL